MDFARRAYDQASEDAEFGSNVLEYDDIQRLVHSDPRYNFLIDTIPKRIKFSEACKLVESKRLLAEEQLNNLRQQQQQLLQNTKPPPPPTNNNASSVADEVEVLTNSDS